MKCKKCGKDIGSRYFYLETREGKRIRKDKGIYDCTACQTEHLKVLTEIENKKRLKNEKKYGPLAEHIWDEQPPEAKLEIVREVLIKLIKLMKL